MLDRWFSNKGQMSQLVLAAVSCFFAGVKAWPEMKDNQLLSLGALLFYTLVGAVVLSAVILISRIDTRKVKLQVTKLDARSTDPKITYKAKFRAVFTNDTGRSLHVMPPCWTTCPEDVPVQYPFGYRYQTERTLGSWQRNEWNQQELTEARIEPGWSFTVYVGLDQSVPHDELERRRSMRRLGTLSIPLKVGTEHFKWEERV